MADRSSRTPAPPKKSVLSRAVRFDRSSWRPPFDITEELASNRETYAGTEPVTIYTFPTYLRTCLDRVRSRVVSTSKPGLSPTITACLSSGISILGAQTEIRELLSLKERFDLIDNADAWLVDDLAAVFNFFPLSTSDRSMAGSGRQNVQLTSGVKQSVGSLASDTGASFSALSVMAITVSLHDQPAVLQERREEMEKAIDGFLRRAKIRCKMLGALVEVLG